MNIIYINICLIYQKKDKGKCRENKTSYEVFSAEIKKYSEIFNKEDFKFRHLEEFENIIDNKKNSNEKKGELLLNLIQNFSVESIELKMMKETQITKDGKFACLTPCKLKYPKFDSIKYYYPSNKCQCETYEGIKECNRSACV